MFIFVFVYVAVLLLLLHGNENLKTNQQSFDRIAYAYAFQVCYYLSC